MPTWLFFRGPLGTNKELSKMDFILNASPFVWVPAKSSIDLTTMNFVHRARPFISYVRG